METPTEFQGLYLEPDQLVTDDNIRFGLKESRVQSLMQSILDRGGVMEPLEVEATTNGTYKITDGAYRREAVARLNKEQGAGLLLPCMVVDINSGKERVMRQLEHNGERENMTPMDTAYAIKKLMDMGISRTEIRGMFKRPGGAKGNKIQPASNSFLNMMLCYLDLPKTAQRKIHEGDYGVAGAYTLYKTWLKDPNRINAVIAELDSSRAKLYEDQEKDEERYLNSIKKVEEVEAKQVSLASELEQAKATADVMSAKFSELSKVENDAYAKTLVTDKAEKDKAQAELKESKSHSAEALKAFEESKKTADKLAAKLETAKKEAEKIRNKLEAKRKETSKKKKAVTSKDVVKAAKKVGVEDAGGHVQLKLAEIRSFISELALPSSQPKVQAIGKALLDCINGITTDKECMKALAMVTGETPVKKAKVDKVA